MKKLIISIIVVTLLIILAAFSKNKNDEDRLSPTPQATITLFPEVSEGEDKTEDVVDEVTFTIEDYFPFEADTEYVYEGEGNEYAAYRRFIDYIDARIRNSRPESITVVRRRYGSCRL